VSHSATEDNDLWVDKATDVDAEDGEIFGDLCEGQEHSAQSSADLLQDLLCDCIALRSSLEETFGAISACNVRRERAL
jgi:hypothetical protein